MASMQSDTEDGVHILGAVHSLSPTSLGDTINITVQTQSMHKVSDDDCGEPLSKKARLDDELPVDTSQSIKQILFNINRAICLRLDCIESRLDTVMARTKLLEEKVDQIHNYFRTPPNGAFSISPDNGLSGSRKSNAVIVGVPQNREGDSKANLMKFIEGDSKAGLMKLIGSQYNQTGDHSIPNLGPNVTLITLNSEEDYPDGVWLGDENNPEMRVRVPITPSDLLHIHSNCRTSEKMALTLLDYLFDRETQACSNLSGMGKHGKRQLDPLMIYGVRCHLIQRFGLTEQDWHRIKQNVDSKCRTAFRRKMRGMSLQVKAFRGKSPSSYLHIDQEMLSGDDSLQRIDMDDGQLHIHEEGVDLTVDGVMTASSAAELLHGAGGGEIQVLHATPEQVAQLQQTHQIQILHGDHVIHQLQSNQETDRVHGSVPMTSPSGLSESIHVVNSHNALNDSMHVVSSPGGLQESIQVVSSPGGLHDGMQVVSVRTESGETIQIQTQPDDDAQDSEQPTDSDQ